MDISELISKVKSSRKYEGHIVHIEDIPTKEPIYGSAELKPLINYALSELSIKQLYTHLTEAVEKAREEYSIIHKHRQRQISLLYAAYI